MQQMQSEYPEVMDFNTWADKTVLQVLSREKPPEGTKVFLGRNRYMEEGVWGTSIVCSIVGIIVIPCLLYLIQSLVVSIALTFLVIGVLVLVSYGIYVRLDKITRMDKRRQFCAVRRDGILLYCGGDELHTFSFGGIKHIASRLNLDTKNKNTQLRKLSITSVDGNGFDIEFPDTMIVNFEYIVAQFKKFDQDRAEHMSYQGGSDEYEQPQVTVTDLMKDEQDHRGYLNPKHKR